MQLPFGKTGLHVPAALDPFWGHRAAQSSGARPHTVCSVQVAPVKCSGPVLPALPDSVTNLEPPDRL